MLKSRIKQRIAEMAIYHLSFFPNIYIILLKRYLSRQCLIPNFGSESRPLLKFSNGHFPFQIPCIVNFICAIIGLPNRIVLAFLGVTMLRTNVPAGFVRLVGKRIIAICIIPTTANQKVFPTVLAAVRQIVLSYTVKEIIV